MYLPVGHDVIPLDRADAFQQGKIDSICDRSVLTEDPGDFPRLPLDEATSGSGSGSCRLSAALGLTTPDCPPPRQKPNLGAQIPWPRLSIDFPGAGTGFLQGTYANSINAAGEITGAYTDANGAFPRLPVPPKLAQPRWCSKGALRRLLFFSTASELGTAKIPPSAGFGDWAS